jgi:hypothetical protein
MKPTLLLYELADQVMVGLRASPYPLAMVFPLFATNVILAAVPAPSAAAFAGTSCRVLVHLGTSAASPTTRGLQMNHLM